MVTKYNSSFAIIKAIQASRYLMENPNKEALSLYLPLIDLQVNQETVTILIITIALEGIIQTDFSARHPISAIDSSLLA